MSQATLVRTTKAPSSTWKSSWEFALTSHHLITKFLETMWQRHRMISAPRLRKPASTAILCERAIRRVNEPLHHEMKWRTSVGVLGIYFCSPVEEDLHQKPSVAKQQRNTPTDLYDFAVSVNGR